MHNPGGFSAPQRNLRAPGDFQRGKAASSVLGVFLPKLTKAVFEKQGFASATLVTDWETIVGRDIAAKCRPLKLTWPRVQSATGVVSAMAADGSNTRPGGRLTLLAEPAFAVEIPYLAAKIKDRINSYYGYRAVEQVRVNVGDQAVRFETHPARHTPRRCASNTEPVGCTAEIRLRPEDEAEIHNERLRDALSNLGASLKRHRLRSRFDKSAPRK